jgi:hypothetical protein
MTTVVAFSCPKRVWHGTAQGIMHPASALIPFREARPARPTAAGLASLRDEKQ